MPLTVHVLHFWGDDGKLTSFTSTNLLLLI